MMKTKKETLLKYKNKKVRIYLTNNKLYTGRILSVSDDVCEMLDKFGLNVTVSNDAVQQLELLGEEGGDVNGNRNSR